MPVDKQALRDTIREAVGDDGEMYALLEQKLMANDDMATKFLGGFMRNRDYTSKTQALASDRQSIADEKRTMEGQLEQYRQLLQAAETDKAKVMKELAQRKIDVATANTRLQHIKQTYQLSNDDIPDIPDQIETYQTRKPVDSSMDIETRLAEFKKEINKDLGTYIAEKLVPELGGLARLPGIFDDVRYEHKELTGKRLTQKEHDALLEEADRRSRAGRPVSYRDLWEEKFEIASLRQKHHDEDLIKEHKAKWEAEQQAKISEAAMQGIRPGMEPQGLRTSQIFDHKFKVHEETQPAAAPKLREAPSAAERQALSGAERATKRHLERRGAGVPMGAPDERKAGKVA